MGALNIPSAADIERLTRRLRSVSQRLEGIEDGVDRLDQRLEAQTPAPAVDERLAAIEGQLAASSAPSSARSPPSLDARPAPQPREQERLEVDEKPKPKAKPKRERRKQAQAGSCCLAGRARQRRLAEPQLGGVQLVVADALALGHAVGDDQQAAGGDAAQPRDREQRGRLHLHRHRAGRDASGRARSVSGS